MPTRQIDPDRRCLRVDQWPEADRAALQRAFRKGSILDDHGPGANWSEPTRKSREKIYGRWINFLARSGELDPASHPAERVTRDRVAGFVELLQSQVAPFTVWSYLDRLYAALRVMAPDTDWGWFRKVVNRLYRQKGPARSLTNRLVPPSRIVAAGLKMMREAEAASGIRPIWHATRYRDGLMLALLAARPLRLKNISDIAIGRHLVRVSMSTHLFRHALATHIAINDPASVHMAMAILDHGSFATTDRYYIMAQGLEASRAHGRMIDELRAESTGGTHSP